jgi:hypothetical protein
MENANLFRESGPGLAKRVALKTRRVAQVVALLAAGANFGPFTICLGARGHEGRAAIPRRRAPQT